MSSSTIDRNPEPLSRSLETLKALAAEDLLSWASEEFGPRLALTCSWQKQSSVLLHMIDSIGVRPAVIELDTHLSFRETYETRDRLVERYGLTLISPRIPTIAEQHRAEGPNLWERNPDRCCHVRKVEPLIEGLASYGASRWSGRGSRARRRLE